MPTIECPGRRQRCLVSLTGLEVRVNPCFWVWRYYEVDPAVATNLFGVSSQKCEDYYLKHLLGYEDDSDPVDEDLEKLEGSTLTIPFPEHYTWTIQFRHAAYRHRIFHPQVYSDGASIAEESAHGSLPGLRWSELKQMVACLHHWGRGAFDAKAIFPLLYPVVWLIPFDELTDVRQTLRTAWDALHMLEPSKLERWLDEVIIVYDQGRMLSSDPSRGWHEPSEMTTLSREKSLWTYDSPRGWHTGNGLRQDASTFASFFSMLERYAPVQE